MKHLRLISLLLCLFLLVGVPPSMAQAEEEEEAALLVDGVAVTEENAADILGNGVFSYNAEQNTLYICGRYTGTSGEALIENRIEGLKIYADHPVNEEGKRSELTTSGVAILSHTDLVLTGYSGLHLRSGDGVSCVEMRNGAQLTVRNTNLKIQAGTHALAGSGSAETLAISFSLLDLESEQEAVWGFNGALTLEGGMFEEPAATVIRDNEILSYPTDENGEVTGPAYRPAKLSIYTYADANHDKRVDVDDTVRLMGLIYFCRYYDTWSPEIDFDGDGVNDPEDAAVLLQSLFPEGALKRIIVASYDPDNWQCLGSFVVDGPEDIGDAELDFCARAKYLRFFCLGEGMAPLCKKAGARIPAMLSIMFGEKP